MMRYLVLLTCLTLTLTPTAKAIENEKRIEIDALIALFDTRQLTTLMANALTYQMTQSLSQKYGQLDKAVGDLILTEASVIMYEEYVLNGKLNDIFYDLYDEYYTAEQLRELVAFYETPTGKLTLSAGPAISRRSMAQAKQHAASIGPKINQRIEAKLRQASELFAADEQTIKEPGG